MSKVESDDVEATDESLNETKGSAVPEVVETPFSTKTWREDVTLVVEDKPLYVSKHVLACASPVFDVMFTGEFKEKDQKEIPLPGKIYDDFVEFLRCIYPGIMQSITLDNVFKVLPLAHEYQVKTLASACDMCFVQHLSQSKQYYNVYELLETAFTYNLEKAAQKCIDSVAERLDDDEFENKISLPEAVHNAIRTKRLQILKTKYKDVFGHVKTSRALYQFLGIKAKENDLYENYMAGKVTGDMVNLTVCCSTFKASTQARIGGNFFSIHIFTAGYYNDSIEMKVALNSTEQSATEDCLYAVRILNRIDGKDYITAVSKFQLNQSNSFYATVRLNDIGTDTLKDQEAGFSYKGSIEMRIYLFNIK